MKYLHPVLFVLIAMVAGMHNVAAQPNTSKQAPPKKTDNYTVQYLIIYNDKGEVLLRRNNAGWHTLAIRSNEDETIREAMDSLAASVGLKITDLYMAGHYVYRFEGLPDHKEASFRTHFTATMAGGQLKEPTGGDREYRWFPVKEAIEKITFDTLRLETSQILNHPDKVWGGTFLIKWKDGKLVGSSVLEQPYPLTK